MEQLSAEHLQVRKVGGHVAAFDKALVRKSIERAAIRAIEPERIDAIVDQVVEDAYRTAEAGSISTAEISAAILGRLREARHSATHVRFALVQYGRKDRRDGRRGWDGVDQVVAWLKSRYPELDDYRRPNALDNVVKKSGRWERYRREKLEQSIRAVSKGRGATDDRSTTLVRAVVAEVERSLDHQSVVTSGQIAAEVMRSLRQRDHIVYLQYASAAKSFDRPKHFKAEALGLKASPVRSPTARADPGAAPPEPTA